MSTSPGWGLPVGTPPFGPGYDGYDPRLAEASVTWGGVQFRVTEGSAPNVNRDVSIGRSGLIGWWDPALDATSSERHQSGHGSVPGMLRLAPRTIEVRGLIRARDFTHLHAIKTFMGKQRLGTLVVGEKAITTEVDVRLVALTFSDITDALATYSLTLLADDPLRYGGARVLKNGANPLENRGGESAFPVIELTGPHNAISITHPNGVFTFPALASGTRIIDCRAGAVWNGNARTFPAISGPFPVNLAAGSSWTISGLGSGSARVKRFEAWS